MRGLLALALLWTAPAAAQKEKLKPLEFTAEKNNVQILSQRFEYAIVDAEKLKVGDILIDASKLKFSIVPSKEGNRLHFTWPAALLSDGRLSVLNNNGKAVWSESFDARSVQVAADQTIKDEDVRSDIASHTSEPLDPAVFDELKTLPFLNFCVSKETDRTKIYLCSRDVFVKLDPSGNAELHARAAAKKEALVEINGKKATKQGLIYLNEASEDLSLLGRTESGASLEVITRKREIEFYDVTLSSDGRSLLIRARGAQPARTKGVRRLDGENYEVSLPKGRPYYYILGDGGIPMRQEFLVGAALPTDDVRPYLSAATPDRTYAAAVDLLGVHPAGVKIEADGDELTPLPKNRFTWSWNHLQPGVKNRRFLNVVTESQGSFVGSYEIERGRANVLNLDLFGTSPNGILVGAAEYQRWLENVLGPLRSGVALEFMTNLSKKDDVVDSNSLTLVYRYRFTNGFALRDPSGGAGLLATQFNFAGSSTTAPGLELFQQFHLARFAFIPWSEARFRYWMASSGSDVKLASGWRLTIEGLTNIAPQSGFAVRGLVGASQFKIDGADDAKMQLEAGLGLHLRF